MRADSPEHAQEAEARALSEIDRLARVFSNHDPESEFRRWRAAPGGGPVSADLFALMAEADRLRRATGGAFDPRAEGLVRLWKTAADEGRVPTEGERAEVLRALRDDPWRLLAEGRIAERRGDSPLTLDAIAKGYIIELAGLSAFRADLGIRGILLNCGGDLFTRGEPSRRIAIADASGGSENDPPIALLDVADRAVATSGGIAAGTEDRGSALFARRRPSHGTRRRGGLASDGDRPERGRG